MRKAAADERGNSISLLLCALTVLLIALLVAWHLRAYTPPRPGRLSDAVTQPSHSNADNAIGTYSFGGRVLPKLASSYKLLYQSVTSGSVAADYLTSASGTAVHADIVAACRAHQFRFIASGDNSSTVTCVGSNVAWKFSVMPASDILQQPWYQSITPIDEAALGRSTWLTVTAGPFITD